jgi:hypothetical protein
VHENVLNAVTYLDKVGRVNLSSRRSLLAVFTEWFSFSISAGVLDDDGVFCDKLDTFLSVLGQDSLN